MRKRINFGNDFLFHMRIFLIIFFGGCLLSEISSCRQNVTGTLDYKALQFDTNRIAIFKWDTTKYSSYNSEPLPLQQEDLFIIDSFLTDAIDSFNANISPKLYRAFSENLSRDSFTINPGKYRYQYFPFKDVNGEKIILITGFISEIPSWKIKPYNGRLHYGITKLELKINLTKRNRDDLRSGDYG